MLICKFVSMAIREIKVLPDEILRQKAKRVSIISPSINRLIKDMTDTLKAYKGVGLAAPQIGVSLRVIVIQLPEEEPFALINPQIIKRIGSREVIEGCLSIPGYEGKIKRSIKVSARGLDPKGKEVRIKGEELLAQALEHEIDHLNGILYIDHLASEQDFYKLEPATLESKLE